MKYMDSGNSQPNLSGNGQPIVSGGSQFGNQPQQSQPVIQTSTPQQPVPQMQGPISSGGGDIVLQVGEKKKIWKKIFIIVSILLVLVVGIFVTIDMVGFGKTGNNINYEFYEILKEHRDGAVNLSTLVDGYLSGELSMMSFMIPEDQYSESRDILYNSLSDLEVIMERVQDGPRLSGIIDGIDLGASYDSLGNVLSYDIDKYKIFVDVTNKIYEVFESQGEEKAVELLKNYDALYGLAVYIDDFFTTRIDASIEYEENDCENMSNEICAMIESSMEQKSNEFMKNSSILQEGYLAVLGNFDHSGEDSIIWYIDELYVAIGAEYER